MSRQQTSPKSVEDTRRRGRPPKFGRPGHVVSLTLPNDTLQALNRVDPDTGWAIVKLLEREPLSEEEAAREPDVELVHIGLRRFLIVVNRAVFTRLPGVNLVPLNDTRAFLSLDPDKGMSDVELAVIDRVSDSDVTPREREALAALRKQLAAWRHDRRFRFHSQSIIVVEQLNAGGRGAARPRRGSA